MFNSLLSFAVKLKLLKTMKFIKKQRKRTKWDGSGVSTCSRESSLTAAHAGRQTFSLKESVAALCLTGCALPD